MLREGTYRIAQYIAGFAAFSYTSFTTARTVLWSGPPARHVAHADDVQDVMQERQGTALLCRRQ